jgi:hypothetical protein
MWHCGSLFWVIDTIVYHTVSITIYTKFGFPSSASKTWTPCREDSSAIRSRCQDPPFLHLP